LRVQRLRELAQQVDWAIGCKGQKLPGAVPYEDNPQAVLGRAGAATSSAAQNIFSRCALEGQLGLLQQTIESAVFLICLSMERCTQIRTMRRGQRGQNQRS
jgi:hypothetical protein